MTIFLLVVLVGYFVAAWLADRRRRVFS